MGKIKSSHSINRKQKNTKPKEIEQKDKSSELLEIASKAIEGESILKRFTNRIDTVLKFFWK